MALFHINTIYDVVSQIEGCEEIEDRPTALKNAQLAYIVAQKYGIRSEDCHFFIDMLYNEIIAA